MVKLEVHFIQNNILNKSVISYTTFLAASLVFIFVLIILLIWTQMRQIWGVDFENKYYNNHNINYQSYKAKNNGVRWAARQDV